MGRTLLVVAGIALLILFSRGIEKGGGNPKFELPANEKIQPEYDCRKHAPDKVCEVPWKDKVVLYCYADAIPRVVRFRDECH